MVRYDKCVDALYDSRALEDRTKTLQIMKVMRGAISVSKSKTGECIFRSNKTERKNLERLVHNFEKDSVYNVARIDTTKKLVVDRWSKFLENQTTCSSQTLLEELLDLGDIPAQTNVSTDAVTDEEHNKLKKLIDLRLKRYENGGTRILIPPRRRDRVFSDSPPEDDVESKVTENKTEMFVTEKKEIRDRYSNDEQNTQKAKIQGSVLAKSTPLRLPSISATKAGFSMDKNKVPEPEVLSPPEYQRDPTDWSDWMLKERKKSYIGYIRREKTRHEDLIIRNALTNIEREMSGANMIKRHQIRQKLQNEREAESRKINPIPGPSTNKKRRVKKIKKAEITTHLPKKLCPKKVEFEEIKADVNVKIEETIKTPRAKKRVQRGILRESSAVSAGSYNGTMPVIMETTPLTLDPARSLTSIVVSV